MKGGEEGRNIKGNKKEVGGIGGIGGRRKKEGGGKRKKQSRCMSVYL